MLRKVAVGVKSLPKPQTIDPKRLTYGLKWYLKATLYDSWCPQTIFFSKSGCRCPQFLLIGQKIVLRKVPGGYIKPSQIHTNALKRLKYCLKWSQEDTLDDSWCFKTIFFQNWGVGFLNFCLLVKNGTPKSAWRLYKSFPNPH